MNTHALFLQFHEKIELTESKKLKLTQNRDALRDKIRGHFAEKGWAEPKFYSQGSFVLGTNLNPIKDEDGREEYDLDDGVYFICPEEDRKQPSTYHTRIKNAVGEHTTKVQDKTTCVRVIYADGHHIDLPSYWLESDGDVPQLAHLSKGYIESDPQAFKFWVEEQFLASGNAEQLRRMIQYLKAWKDFRQTENAQVKIPSGFVLTILACDHFSANDGDDVSFAQMVEAITSALSDNFSCFRPTVPTDEDLLEGWDKDELICELARLALRANSAVNAVNEEDAALQWREVFGTRFPKGEGETENTTRFPDEPARIKVSRPWQSY